MNNNSLNELLSKIFDNTFTQPSIISSPSSIPYLLLELINPPSTSIQNISTITSAMISSFKYSHNNILIFNHYATISNINLINTTIHLITTFPSLSSTLFTLLDLLLSHIPLTKSNFSLIYSRISSSYHEASSSHLSKSSLLLYIELLKHLYGMNITPHKPSCYYYLNDNNSKLKLIISNANTSINLSVSIVFKFDIDFTNKSHLIQYNLIPSKSNIISFIFNNNITLNLCVLNYEQMVLYYNNADTVFSFTKKSFEGWNHISLCIVKDNNTMKVSVMLNDNCVLNAYSIKPSTKTQPINAITHLKSITFCSSFKGEVTSVIINSPVIEVKEHQYIHHHFPYGLYNVNQVNTFIKQLKNNTKLIALYTPFCYSMNVISKYKGLRLDDVNDDRDNIVVQVFEKRYRNISVVGGCEMLLPLLEVIYVNKDKEFDNEVVESFFELVFVVFSVSRKNMKDAKCKRFFMLMSVFLEKMNGDVFTETIVGCLFNVMKNLFVCRDKTNVYLDFVEFVMLNEEIYSKLQQRERKELWELLERFHLQEMNVVTVEQLLRVMVNVDKESTRIHAMCCNEHRCAFNNDSNSDSDKGDTNVLLTQLDKVILILNRTLSMQSTSITTFINNLTHLFNILLLINTPSYSLSPCIITTILNLINTSLISFTSSPSLPQSTLNTILSFFTSNNNKHVLILLNILNTKYLDIKHFLLKLLSTLLYTFPSAFPSLINFPYLQEHLLPSLSASPFYNSTYFTVHMTHIYETLQLCINDDSSILPDKTLQDLLDIILHLSKSTPDNLLNISSLHIHCANNKHLCSIIAKTKNVMEYIIDIMLVNYNSNHTLYKQTLSFVIDVILGLKSNEVIATLERFLQMGSTVNNKEAIIHITGSILTDILKEHISDITLGSNNTSFISTLISLAFEFIVFGACDDDIMNQMFKKLNTCYIKENRISIPKIFNLNLHKQNVLPSSSSSIASVWTDYSLVQIIFVSFHNVFIKHIFHSYKDNIDDIIANTIFNGDSKTTKQTHSDIKHLLSMTNNVNEYIASCKALSHLYMITLSISKACCDEFETLCAMYRVFLLGVAVLSMKLPQQDTRLYLNTIAFGVCFLFELVEGYANGSKEYMSIVNIINDVLYFTCKVSMMFHVKKKMGMFANMFYNKLSKEEMKVIEDSAVMEFDYFFIKQVLTTDKFEVLSSEKQKQLYDVLVNDCVNTRNVFSVNNPHVNDEYRRYVQFEVLFKKQKRRNSINNNSNSSSSSNNTTNTQQQQQHVLSPTNNTNSNNNSDSSSLDTIIKETVDQHLHSFLNAYEHYHIYHQSINRNLYKKIKKHLFSWNNSAYSNKPLFYPSNPKQTILKYKILNHYTDLFTRPFLTPILDIHSYLPSFSQFANINKLFNDNDTYITNETKYIVNCNINSILNDDTASSLLKSYHNESLNDCCSSKYKCCLVKTCYHIQGHILISPNSTDITFKVNHLQNKYDNDDVYDHTRGTCFGSYFLCKNRTNSTIEYAIPFTNIKFVFKRNYYYTESAFEIFTNDNKSYYFNFNSKVNRDACYESMFTQCKGIAIKNITDDVIGYTTLHTYDHCYDLKAIINEWKTHNISTFEYLMYLNIYSNRSYNDISQYPVFPWIISEYETKITNDSYRDLSLPMGMLTINAKSEERKDNYIDNYNTMLKDITHKPQQHKQQHLLLQQITNIPYHYGSHYSNPIYISHYLTRLFPYTHLMIELQGDNFDDPNRMFISMKNSFEGACTQKGDVREIIPEFFYLPEMFVNVNNLNMGVKNDGTKVNDVICPDFASKHPYKTSYMLSVCLESEIVSANINEWIDLIFGYKQFGDAAKESNNVFMYTTYLNNVNIDSINGSNVDKVCFLRMVEFGLTPKQLFKEESPKRVYNASNKNECILTKDKNAMYKTKINLNCNGKNNFKYISNVKAISSIADIRHKESLLLLYCNNECDLVNLQFTTMNNDDNNNNTYNSSNNTITSVNVSSISNINHGISEYIPNTPHYHKYKHFPIIIYSNNTIIAEGGYPDCKIMLTHFPSSSNFKHAEYIAVYPPYRIHSCIELLCMNASETFAIACDSNGLIFVFSVSHTTWLCINTLTQHYSVGVTYVHISSHMNAFASCSAVDGYIHIYTLPQCKVVHSFYKDKTHVCLLNSGKHLNICVIYSQQTKSFISYSVNGKELNQRYEKNIPTSCRIIEHINKVDEYLLYSVRTEIVVIDLPFLGDKYRIDLALTSTSVTTRDVEYIVEVSADKQLIYAVETYGQFMYILSDQLFK